MSETIKKLKIKGLYLKSIKISSNRYCELVSENNGVVRRYTSKPIGRITDFVNLINESLSDLNWELDEYNDSHREAILKMERRIHTNQFGILEVSN